MLTLNTTITCKDCDSEMIAVEAEPGTALLKGKDRAATFECQECGIQVDVVMKLVGTDGTVNLPETFRKVEGK